AAAFQAAVPAPFQLNHVHVRRTMRIGFTVFCPQGSQGNQDQETNHQPVQSDGADPAQEALMMRGGTLPKYVFQTQHYRLRFDMFFLRGLAHISRLLPPIMRDKEKVCQEIRKCRSLLCTDKTSGRTGMLVQTQDMPEKPAQLDRKSL